MFEFLSDTSLVLYFLVFIIFIIVAYKLFKFLAKAFIVGLLASLFPVIGNLLFGLDLPVNLNSMIWFGVTGIGLFFLYSLVRTGWSVLKIITRPFRWFGSKGKKKE